jgi:hypothetical protein
MSHRRSRSRSCSESASWSSASLSCRRSLRRLRCRRVCLPPCLCRRQRRRCRRLLHAIASHRNRRRAGWTAPSFGPREARPRQQQSSVSQPGAAEARTGGARRRVHAASKRDAPHEAGLGLNPRRERGLRDRPRPPSSQPVRGKGRRRRSLRERAPAPIARRPGLRRRRRAGVAGGCARAGAASERTAG